MYLCIHACMHTYIHTYIHTYVHTYIHIYIHIYIYAYVHAYTHTQRYIRTYISANNVSRHLSSFIYLFIYLFIFTIASDVYLGIAISESSSLFVILLPLTSSHKNKSTCTMQLKPIHILHITVFHNANVMQQVQYIAIEKCCKCNIRQYIIL